MLVGSEIIFKYWYTAPWATFNQTSACSFDYEHKLPWIGSCLMNECEMILIRLKCLHRTKWWRFFFSPAGLRELLEVGYVLVFPIFELAVNLLIQICRMLGHGPRNKYLICLLKLKKKTFLAWWKAWQTMYPNNNNCVFQRFRNRCVIFPWSYFIITIDQLITRNVKGVTGWWS